MVPAERYIATMSRSALSLVAVAGLYGAVGVATAALAAHRVADPSLSIASNFLLLHAAALPGVAAASVALGLGRLALIPAWGVALGVLMFSGDLLVRVWLGASPLPMVAPTGGTLLIASWLALGVGAVIGLARRPKA